MKDEPQDDTDPLTVTSLLFVSGKVSGADLVSHLLSCIVEHREAKIELFRLAKTLARMQSEGHLDVKTEHGEHMWSLTKDASRDWCNEVLRAKETKAH